MIKIIGEHGSGKTTELIKKASEAGGMIICEDPDYIISKSRALGITNVDAVRYHLFNAIDVDCPLFVDNVEVFLEFLGVKGFTCEV